MSRTVRESLEGSITATADVDAAVRIRVALARINRSLRLSSDRTITPSQTSALARIGESGSLRLGVLATLEGIAPATMSKVVDSLDTQGLVQRGPDALDGRACLIQLSSDGQALLHRLRATSDAAIDQSLASLSPTERTTVQRALPVLEKLSRLLQANAATSLNP